MIRKIYNASGRFRCFAEATLAPLWNLLARIYLFIVFYKSAILKVSDILNGHSDRVIFLFAHEYKLPMPEILGPLASFVELACAFLVLIGLFSRLSAFALLIMSIFIQFWYLEHVSHILWMFLSSYVVVYGGGRLSVDAIWCKTIGSLGANKAISSTASTRVQTKKASPAKKAVTRKKSTKKGKK